MLRDAEFLSWMADRLVFVYGESPNIDFVHYLRRLATEAEKKERRRALHRYIAVRVLAFLFGTAVMLALGSGYVVKVAWELWGALGR